MLVRTIPRRHPAGLPQRALVAASLLVAALAPASASAQAFEGVVTMHVPAAGSNGQPAPDIEYLVRNGRVRLNVRSPMGRMSMIVVPEEKKMFMVIDQQQAYVEMPTDFDKATTAAQSATLTRTGRKETIAGYECEHVTVTDGNANAKATDVCLAKGIGGFVSMPMGGATPAWQRQLLADGSFPLRVVTADGKTQLEVTKIERKPLNAGIFEVPDSYTKVEAPRRPPGR